MISRWLKPNMPLFVERQLCSLLDWAGRACNQQRYPDCCSAIRDLQGAAQREAGPRTAHTRGRRLHEARARAATGAQRATTGARDAATGAREIVISNYARVALWRKQKKIDVLTSKLKAFQSSKIVGGVISASWILRVILTAPNVSGRSMAEAFHLVVGSDSSMVSRESVKNIRAAFLEIWKNMIFASLRDFIAAQRRGTPKAVAAATGAIAATSAIAGPNVVCVHVSHVQDEAELRLLSSDPSNRAGLPRRSRTSKVQMHVVTVTCGARGAGSSGSKVMGQRSWGVLVELEGLVDKTAATLATSFERLVNTLLENMLPRPQPSRRKDSEPEVWLVHAIIGDAISTNGAAAKILWAMAATGAFKKVRYFLLVGKCGTHQSALSAKDGVIGRAAAAAAEAAGEGKEFEDVVATVVRIFKYLVLDYYEDFKLSIAKWVNLHVEVVVPEAASSHAARMQILYTKNVIPDELLQLWHSSTPAGKLQTVAKRGQDHTTIKDEWTKFILEKLLRVDTHPTLTRFFSFRGAVDRMLTMALLNLPATGGLSTKTSAREVGQKRLKRVSRWFSKPASPQALRRDSLVLQLTSAMEAFMSTNPKEGDPQ